MSEKSDKLRAMLEKEKERRIKLNNRIEILERRIQEEDSAEVNEMVRTAKVTPEQLAALLRQSANTTSNPARSEEHTSELQSRFDLVCRLLLEKKKKEKHTQKTAKERVSKESQNKSDR